MTTIQLAGQGFTFSGIGRTGIFQPPDTCGVQECAKTPGAFRLDSIRYEFDAAAPVPEPTSMLLIGSGLAGLAALRKRRNRGRAIEG